MFVNGNTWGGCFSGVFAALVLTTTAYGQVLRLRSPADAAELLPPTTATLYGELRWTAAIPDPAVFEVRQDSYVCGTDGKIERVVAKVNPQTRTLEGACLYIDHVPGGRKWTEAERHAQHEIWFDDCSIRPGLVPVPLHGTLSIRSAESVWHIALVPRRGRTVDMEFDLATRGARQRAQINLSGPVRIQCQRHKWETGYVFGAETPYVAVSDGAGKFRIEDLPPGSYELKVWHPPVTYTPTMQNGRITDYVPGPPILATVRIRKAADSPLALQIDLPGGESRPLPQ